MSLYGTFYIYFHYPPSVSLKHRLVKRDPNQNEFKSNSRVPRPSQEGRGLYNGGSGDGRAYKLMNMFDGTVVDRAAEKLKIYVERDEILDKIEESYLTATEEEEEESEIRTEARARRPPQWLDVFVR